MFIVFSKEKINTYLVSIIMVIFLFVIANMITNPKIVETASVNNRLLPIYNVKTDKKEIAFTINCAW